MTETTSIKDLLTQYVRIALDEDENQRAKGLGLKGGTEDMEDSEYEVLLETLTDAMGDVRLQRAVGETYARRALAWTGTFQNSDASICERMCREALRAQIEIESTRWARRTGEYGNPYDDGSVSLGVAGLISPRPPSKLSPALHAAPDDTNELRLSDLLARYMAEKKLCDAWTPKTYAENRAVFRLLQEILRNPPVSQLDREMMKGLLATLKRLPPNIHKSRRHRGKSIEEILEMPDVVPISANTIRKYMRRISGVLNWAVDQRFIRSNPTARLTITRKRRADEEREPYSAAEMHRLFEKLPDWVQRGQAFRVARFWVPLIAAHSGMRLNEICQLHIEDIVEREGVWCFSIDGKGSKKLKTRAAKRLVPIHPLLVELGLLDYWKRAKALGHARLWPGLRRKRDGYGQDFSKPFGDFNRRHVTASPKVVFHSLRHNVANALKQAGVEESLRSDLLGHEYKGTENETRYGKRYNPRTLFDVVKLLDHGLDTDPLKKAAKSVLAQIPPVTDDETN